MSTESRNPRSIGLDKMSAREIVRLMNEEEMTVMRAMSAAESQLAVVVEKAAEAVVSGGRVIYVGAGTSGRIATMDAAEMPPTFGSDPGLFVAVSAGGEASAGTAIEDAEDNDFAAVEAMNAVQVSAKDVVIGLAASGKTPFVIAACRHASQKGAWTCGIANNRKAPLFDTGPEVLTGSTRLKAGTAQKLALNRVSTGAMVLAGKVIENLMVDVKANNQKLKDRCARIVMELSPATLEEAWELLESHDWNVRAVLEALAVPAV